MASRTGGQILLCIGQGKVFDKKEFCILDPDFLEIQKNPVFKAFLTNLAKIFMKYSLSIIIEINFWILDFPDPASNFSRNPGIYL